MKVYWVLFCGLILFNLVGCASSGRALKVEEIQRHGLSGGVAYDVPLCPIQVDDLGHSQVTGPCEYVSCEPVAQKIVCRAYKSKRFGK